MREKESPFACDMTAIAPEQRGAHLATIEKLFRSVQSKRELPDGYAFELPNDSEVLLTTADFISQERLCCPFFGFRLEIEREGGSVWLSLTGRDGAESGHFHNIRASLLLNMPGRTGISRFSAALRPSGRRLQFILPVGTGTKVPETR